MELILTFIAALCGVISVFGSGCSVYKKIIKTSKKLGSNCEYLARTDLSVTLKHASTNEYFITTKIFPKRNYSISVMRGVMNQSVQEVPEFELLPSNSIEIRFSLFEPFPRFVIIIFRNSKIWKSKIVIFRLI